MLERQTTCVQIQRDQKIFLRYQNICDMNSIPLGIQQIRIPVYQIIGTFHFIPHPSCIDFTKKPTQTEKISSCSLLQPWRISNTSLLPQKLSEKLRSSSVRESCYRLTSSMYARIQWNSSCSVCGNVHTHCLMWKHMHIFIGLKFHCF